MKASNKFITAIVTALLTTAGIHTVSHAAPPADGKIYSGNMCQPLYGNPPNVYSTHYWGIRNVDTVERAVSCPVVRDNTQNKDGTWNPSASSRKGVVVRVEDLDGGKLTCHLYSLTKFSINKDSDAAVTQQAGRQELYLTVKTSDPGGGSYGLLCYLPPKGAVFNYWVREYSPTDPN